MRFRLWYGVRVVVRLFAPLHWTTAHSRAPGRPAVGSPLHRVQRWLSDQGSVEYPLASTLVSMFSIWVPVILEAPKPCKAAIHKDGNQTKRQAGLGRPHAALSVRSHGHCTSGNP